MNNMMAKSYGSSEVEDSTKNASRDQYLKHLNRISDRISKPTTRRPPLDLRRHQSPPAAPPQNLQPPVYNIHKNEFRDVVQKLTGSPAHDRSSSSSSFSGTPAPPPDPNINPPKPQSSRLQRIRPPPLSAVANRLPTPAAASAPPPSNSRQVSPFSPLPPFPSAYGAAESPVSAYMRHFHRSAALPSSSYAAADSDPKHSSQPLISPLRGSPAPPPASTAPAHFPVPSSPLPFGRSVSPYPLLSPGRSLFSPTADQLGFPQIPPAPSPRWRGVTSESD